MSLPLSNSDMIFLRKDSFIFDIVNTRTHPTVKDIHTEITNWRNSWRWERELPIGSLNYRGKLAIADFGWCCANVGYDDANLDLLAMPNVARKPYVLNTNFRSVRPSEGLVSNASLQNGSSENEQEKYRLNGIDNRLRFANPNEVPLYLVILCCAGSLVIIWIGEGIVLARFIGEESVFGWQLNGYFVGFGAILSIIGGVWLACNFGWIIFGKPFALLGFT